MVNKLIFILALLFSFSSQAQKDQKKKIVYKYKKFESFDFEKMSVSGDSNHPGDLSINPRFNIRFSNRLPEKPRFENEVIDSMDSIQ